MEKKRVLLAAPPFSTSSAYMLSMSGDPTSVQIQEEKSSKVLYDELFNVILRNTVFRKLTNGEVEKLSLTFDQHLALLNLGGHLINHGIFTKFALTEWRRGREGFIDRLLKIIDQENITLLGFSMTTPDYPEIQILSKAFKEARPNLQIVIGGCHPTFMAKQILEETPEIDFVIMGPGNNSMVELASGMEYSKIAGFAYRENGEVRINAVNKGRSDFLGISYPFDYEYAIHPKREFPLARIFSRLGCNMNCYYCCDRVWHEYMHEIVVSKLRQEIYNLYTLRNTRYFYIHTEDILSHLEHFKKVANIFTELRKKDDKVHYSVQVTANSINKTSEEDLIEIGKSGLNWFQTGLESVDPKINVKADAEQFEAALRKIKKCCPNAHTTVYLLVGLPGDSEEKTMRTMEYCERLAKEGLITAVFMGIFIPYPATRVYWNPEKYNIVIDDSDWRKFGYIFQEPPYHYKDWAAKDIYNTYEKALDYACKILQDRIKQMGFDEKFTMPFYDVV